MSDEYPVTLDSARQSRTIAECRHLARLLLPEVLDAFHEIVMNPTSKNSDRIAAGAEIRKFAEGSEDDEKQIVPKLSAAVARKIAKLGKRFEQTGGRNEVESNQGRGETGTSVDPAGEVLSLEEGSVGVGGGPADDSRDGEVPD